MFVRCGFGEVRWQRVRAGCRCFRWERLSFLDNIVVAILAFLSLCRVTERNARRVDERKDGHGGGMACGFWQMTAFPRAGRRSWWSAVVEHEAISRDGSITLVRWLHHILVRDQSHARMHACRMKATTSGRLDGRRRRMQVRWMHGSSNGIGREAEVRLSTGTWRSGRDGPRRCHLCLREGEETKSKLDRRRQCEAKQEAIYQQELRNWRETRQGDMEARALDCRRDNAWWANLHSSW